MKKLIILLLSVMGCSASTVYTCGLISAFGTQPTGTLIFYPVAGTYGTNIETTLSQSVPFVNGCFTNLTLTGGNYEVDYYNRMLLNIFVPFQDTNNWQLTDLATNLTSYVTVGQLGVFSNNVYNAALLAGQAATATPIAVLSNLVSLQITNVATNFTYTATNLLSGTFYTNGSKRAFITAWSQLVSANGNTPSCTLYVGPQATIPGLWATTNQLALALTGGAAGQTTIAGEVSTIIPPNYVFAFTNTAGGGTSTAQTNSCVILNF